MKTDEFEGRIYWVTGASGALGSAIAQALAKRGARVIVSGRDESTLPENGKHIERMPVDVTHRDGVDSVVEKIKGKYGTIDGLVTCTTVPGFGDFLALEDKVWDEVINVKLLGTIRTVRAVLPEMILKQGGSIVMIGGRGGTIPPPRHLPGACVNAALNLLSQGLATEYGKDRIRINVVAPGPIVSPRLEVMQKGVANATSALGGAGSPEDVASAVIYLLSASARHITGIVFPVDGGRAPAA